MWLSLLYLFGGIGLVLFVIWKFVIHGNKSYWPSRNVALVHSSEYVSLWDQLSFKYPFHEIELKGYEAFKKKGLSYVGTMEFRKPFLVAMDLDLIKAVMVKDFEYFINRRTIDMDKSDPLFHKMLLNAKNQEWKDLRATMSPTFATGKIRRMFEVFQGSSEKLSTFLRPKVQEGPELNLKDVLMNYTMDVIASSAFGLDAQVFGQTESEFSVMANRFQNQFSGKNMLKVLCLIFFPRLMNYLKIPIADQEVTNFFAGVVQKTIRHRAETGEKRDDFLQLLIETQNLDPKAAAEEEGQGDKMDTYEKDAQVTKATKIPLTEELILAQSLLFFVAGFDTTETLLLFAAYELAVNQDVQEKLYKELEEVAERNDGSLTYDAIMQSEYLDKVISETLRKYPPGIRTERKCVRDYKIPYSNLVVRKDTVVIIPIYGIHHDELYYPDPEKFDPERFSAENKAARNPYSYMPFGHGPRNCIAMRFALMEGKSCIAHLVKDFKLEPSHKTHIPLKYETMKGFKPLGGLWMSVTPRK